MSKLIILLAAMLAGGAAWAYDVDAILKKADVYRMPDQSARVDTLVQTYKAGQVDKEKRYQVLSRKGGKSLVLFRSPGEVGQKVLMVGDDFWMLLPGSARPIRITPMQKLLGDASTGDIATTSWHGDYSGSSVREVDVDGVACLELDLAAQRKSLSYQRIVLQVGRHDYRPVHADLYVVSNRRVKQVRFATGERDGRHVVTRMTLVDEIVTNRETVITILGAQARQFGDELFNPMFLSRSEATP